MSSVVEWLNANAGVATWLEASAVTIAAVLAIMQIAQIRSARRDEARAYPMLYLDFSREPVWLPRLVLINRGRTAASEVTVEYTPAVRSSLKSSNEERALFQAGVPTLPPGQELSTLFDSMFDRPKDWEDVYEVRVRYRDVFGRAHEDVFMVDLGVYRALTYTVRHDLHDVHERLKELVQEINHTRTGFGGPLPVAVTSRGATARDRWARRRFGSIDGPVPSLVIWSTAVWEWCRDEVRALRRWFRSDKK